MSNENGIVSISIFGSYGRGNHDASSDLDVLVVCREGAGTQPEEVVRAKVERHFDQIPEISWYGTEKLSHFFRSGDLFAWHLYTESYPLPGYASLADTFGRPQSYMNCLDDIKGLREILCSIPGHISKNPQNTIYELGLAYVCLRNIAMTASSVLCKTPIFGRYSAFELPGVASPISREDYTFLAQCRHASTRGAKVPELNIDASAVLRDSILWAKSLERKVL